MGRAVFIVSSGAHSDYGIDAVFDNSREAELFARAMSVGQWEKFCVEKGWKIDETAEAAIRRYFSYGRRHEFWPAARHEDYRSKQIREASLAIGRVKSLRRGEG